MTDESIFAAALAIPILAERAAYLERACAGQPALRREVEELLAAHAADNPLDRPPADLGHTGAYEPNPDGPAVASVGDRIGPYRLMEQIGEGGFGLVFVAEQAEPVRRKVALKVLEPGMDTRDVVARFEAERQALALMDHPNIARVFDAGSTPSGRPYFVMELVRGVPITDYCDQHKLPPRDRLALFVQVCQAVQHAHQKGIIHRDLKPSNVLVASHDGVPAPKVIDFGVAKAVGQSLTDKTIYTRFAQMIGTPLYVSPEQAEMSGLDVDTRTDVYALGVVLYELLTGTTPFDRDRFRKAAFDEMRRIIREEEPPRPSVQLSTTQARALLAARGAEPDKLARELRGELDWIVMKALAKERQRRYDTAAALGRDVERYLKDEMVEARPPSLAYRLRKSLRTNRGPVLAAALVLLALVGGVIATTLALVRAWDAEDGIRANLLVAQALKEDASQAQARAEDKARQARENEVRANREALRADTARHAIQMDTIFRAWQRDDLATASDVLAQVPEPFRQSLEYRLLRDACRRRAIPVLAQHRSYRRLHLSPDGKTILAWTRQLAKSGEPTLKCLDAASGQERWKLDVPDIWYFDNVAFSADSKLFAPVHGGLPGHIPVWNLTTGEKRWSVDGPIMAHGQPFSPNGKLLATIAADDLVVVDTATGAEKYRIKQSAKNLEPNLVAFSLDSKLLALALLDREKSPQGPMKIYDAANGKEKLAIKTEFWPTLLSFSPDARRLLGVAGDGSSVKVWDLATGAEKVVRKPPPQLRDAGFLADGKSIVMVSGSHDVKVVDLETGKEKPLVTPFAPTTCASLDADLQRVRGDGIGVFGEWPLLWSLAKTELATALLDTALEDSTVAPFAPIFTSDGKHVCGTLGLRPTFWETRTGRKLRSLQQAANWWKESLHPMSYSLDGNLVVCHEPNHWLIKVFDTTTGKELLSVKGRERGSYSALSPDGQRLAIGPIPAIQIWNLKTGKMELSIPTQANHGESLAFGPAGQIAAHLDRAGLFVWDSATGKQTAQIQEPVCRAIQFFPDGKRVLTHNGDPDGAVIKIWNIQTAQEQGRFLDEFGYGPMVLSPDATRLLCGNQVWDVATGQLVLTFPWHFVACAISPDGRRIIAKEVDPSKPDSKWSIYEAP